MVFATLPRSWLAIGIRIVPGPKGEMGSGVLFWPARQDGERKAQKKVEFVLSNRGDWAGGMAPGKAGRNGKIGRKRRSDFAVVAAVGSKNAQGPKKSAFLEN